MKVALKRRLRLAFADFHSKLKNLQRTRTGPEGAFGYSDKYLSFTIVPPNCIFVLPVLPVVPAFPGSCQLRAGSGAGKRIPGPAAEQK